MFHGFLKSGKTQFLAPKASLRNNLSKAKTYHPRMCMTDPNIIHEACNTEGQESKGTETSSNPDNLMKQDCSLTFKSELK